MKKLIGAFIMVIAFSANVNANLTSTSNEVEAYESCVSIAHRIAGGDSAAFAAAYNGCIHGRCDC